MRARLGLGGRIVHWNTLLSSQAMIAAATTASITTGTVASGLLLLGITATPRLWITTAITWHLSDILDTHPRSKECYCQEEADNEHGDAHEHPCHGFEATEAETLENTCTDEANE